MTTGALLKFRRVPLQEPKRAAARPPEPSNVDNQWIEAASGLTTRSILKMLSDLRAEKRRIEEAISVLERLAAGRIRRT